MPDHPSWPAELVEKGAKALRVNCPECHAGVGEPCRGDLAAKLGPHPGRVVREISLGLAGIKGAAFIDDDVRNRPRPTDG